LIPIFFSHCYRDNAAKYFKYLKYRYINSKYLINKNDVEKILEKKIKTLINSHHFNYIFEENVDN